MVQERFRKKNIAIDELQGQQRKKRLRRRIFYLALILLISAAFFAVCVLVWSAATRPRSARRSAFRSATICSLSAPAMSKAR